MQLKAIGAEFSIMVVTLPYAMQRKKRCLQRIPETAIILYALSTL